MTPRKEKLFNAAEKGDIAAINRLINKDVDINSEALQIATEFGHLEAVKILIPFSDPKADDSDALLRASEGGYADVVQTLIPVSEPEATGSWALAQAALLGHVEVVKLLIPVIHSKDSISFALIQAAKGGHVEVVRLLIPVSGSMANESAALLEAVKNGHRAVVQVLAPLSNVKKAIEEIFYDDSYQDNIEIGDALVPHLSRLMLKKMTEKVLSRDEKLSRMPNLKSYILSQKLSKTVTPSTVTSKPRTRV